MMCEITFTSECSRAWILEIAGELTEAYGVRAELVEINNQAGWKIVMPSRNGWRPLWLAILTDKIISIELR